MIIPPKDQSPRKTSPGMIGLVLGMDLIAELDAIVAATGWSRSEVIRRLLRFGIDAWKKEQEEGAR